jgi:hypothetical protein
MLTVLLAVAHPPLRDSTPFHLHNLWLLLIPHFSLAAVIALGALRQPVPQGTSRARWPLGVLGLLCACCALLVLLLGLGVV